MDMRLKDIEVKHQQMKVKMEVLKMRIELKKNDPTLSKYKIDNLLPLS